VAKNKEAMLKTSERHKEMHKETKDLQNKQRMGEYEQRQVINTEKQNRNKGFKLKTTQTRRTKRHKNSSEDAHIPVL